MINQDTPDFGWASDNLGEFREILGSFFGLVGVTMIFLGGIEPSLF
jgi:hypothetical protein